MTPLQRVMRRLRVEPDGCLTYTGKLNKKGYAEIWDGQGSDRLHRFMYEQTVGPIPYGMQLDHLCRRRHCGNPQHLEPVTAFENNARGLNAKRATCHRGHPFDDENTGYSGRSRYCKQCGRERAAAHHAAKNLRQSA